MTDSSITRASLRIGLANAWRRLLSGLRDQLQEMKAKQVRRRLPDRLLRDGGLTRDDSATPGRGGSWDVATKLEIEELRQRRL
ncbi:MAG: hypothetical protein AAFS07_08305 [Pseudomonadota bacterium]